jgi:type III pantothenate kinase
MLLAIDIGNTNIVLGLYQGKKLITHWRLATQAERTADEYGVIISQLIDYAGYRCDQISAIAVSCVVPPMLTTTQELADKFFKIEPLIVGPGIKTGMPILYESPKDVGADRIVNGIAAYEKFHDSCIIVDFGTATTIDLISRKGEYVGGAIAPGLSI